MYYSKNKSKSMYHLNKYFSSVSKLKYYNWNIKNLESYIYFLYKEIKFKNKKVLDIGGGFGIYSIFSELLGANKIVILEPELAGSNTENIIKFNILKNELELENTYLVNESLQDFHQESDKYDIILLHNSINHLNENACKVLHYDKTAKLAYKNIFKKISLLSNNNAYLIICDCSRYNFFNFIGLKNPISKTIEWEKHQPPELWSKMLKDVGYTSAEIKWLPPKPLRAIGRVLLGHKYISYFINSYFCLKIRKTTPV